MYFSFEVGSDLCENAKAVSYIRAAETGEYPRIFVSNRITELLATLCVNEPISRGDLARLLKVSLRRIQEQLDLLMRAGIVRCMPAYTRLDTHTRMNALFALDRGHALFPETSALLRCLAQKFHAPLAPRPRPHRTIPYRANGIDPTLMLGWSNQRRPLILIAMLGWATPAALRTVLPKTEGTMFVLARALVNSGLVSRQKVGAFAVLRIGLKLPCRNLVVTLLKKLCRLSPTYLQLASNARRALPKLKKRRQKAKRRGHVP